MSVKTPLLTPRQIDIRASAAQKCLRALFGRHKDLQGVEMRAHLSIGLARIAEKRRFSSLLARYMRRRGIRSVASLANLIYIGCDHLEALEWMRSPSAFLLVEPGRRDRYLLALCDIDWDPNMKRYVPMHTKSAH